MRVYAVSDLHTDYKENRAWLETIPSEKYRGDALLVAGDVSDRLEELKHTLEALCLRFKDVFFTPGNHDIWHKREDRELLKSAAGQESAGQQRTSLDKLQDVLNLCQSIGVHTRPTKIEGIWICPLFSWYHASFDQESDIPGALPPEKVFSDFYMCTWPDGMNSADDTLAEYFDQLNEPDVSDLQGVLEYEESLGKRPVVITMSHFLPYQWLLPEKGNGTPTAAKVCGSRLLQTRIEMLKPTAHIFGHTHFNWDCIVRDVRYMQRPLAYPKERRGHNLEPSLVYDTEIGRPLCQSAFWSDFYRRHPNRFPT